MSPRLSGSNEAIRATRIGASEVAALMPCGHPYVTSGDVYARIVHGVRRPPSAVMEMGHQLEALVLRMGAAELGIRVRRNSRTFAHPTLPLAATPDATVPGRSALVEVKTVSSWDAESWVDGPPPYVMVQAQAQMLVTGRRFCHVVALIGGSRLVVRTVEADDDEQFFIAGAVMRFAVNLQAHIPPPDLDPELVLTVTAPEGSVAASGDLLGYGDVLAERVTIRKGWEISEQEARGALELAMAAAGASVVVAPGWTAEAKPVPSTGRLSLRFTPRRESRNGDR